SWRRVYTIHLPSGENVGRYGSPSGRPLSGADRVTPSAGLRSSSGMPLSYAVTTMVFPSGDHAGSAQSAPLESTVGGLFVVRSRTTSSDDPSGPASMTARRFPSGDGAGERYHLT